MNQHTDEGPLALIIPGLRGRGGESFQDLHIISSEVKVKKCTLPAIPYLQQDLNQKACVKALELHLKKVLHDQESVIAYCCSRGTAAFLGYLTQKKPEDQERLCKLLFLEGVLYSGNKAIGHSTECALALPCVSYVPYIRAWLPLGAKCVFPSYNPLGKQMSDYVQNLSPRIPLIIMHSPHDQFTPLEGAQRLYCLARQKGIDAYLIEGEPVVPYNKNANRHLNILCADGSQNCEKKIAAIHAIYKKYELPSNKSLLDTFLKKNNMTEDALRHLFQPLVGDVQMRIEQHTAWKYHLRNCIDYGATLLLFCACFLAYKELLRHKKDLWKKFFVMIADNKPLLLNFLRSSVIMGYAKRH